MSFRVHYSYPGSHTLQTLTGLIAKDGFLYWHATEVAHLLRVHRNVLGSRETGQPTRSFRSLIPQDLSTQCLEKLLRRRMMRHEDVLDCLSHALDPSVQALAEKLQSRETHVQCLAEKKLEDLHDPIAVHLDVCEEESEELFFIWYGLFRAKVMKELYGSSKRTIPILQSEDFVKHAMFEEEEPPEKIVVYWKGKMVPYQRTRDS